MMQRTLRVSLFALSLAALLACSGIQGALSGEPVPAEKSEYVGVWRGVGVDLTITPDGGMDYERTGGMGSTSVNAPIQSWGEGYFEAGLGPITTRFEVDQAPSQGDDGTWRMTVDGVELQRVM